MSHLKGHKLEYLFCFVFCFVFVFVFFWQKGTGAESVDMATTHSCQSVFLVREKHCCNILKIFSIQCFNFLICIIEKRNI